MISDEELLRLIERVTEDFHGDLDEFNRVVGIIVVGRLTGWRVQRLVSPRGTWALTTKWFGDPKKLMPERGRLVHKSLGLKLVDKIGGYWEFIRGQKAIDLEDRRMML